MSLLLVGTARDAFAETYGEREGVLFVTNEDSGDVSIIDLRSLSVRGTLPVGKRPRGIRLSPDRRLLYVATSGSPKAPPGVDESRLPPADRFADGIAVIDLARQKLIRTLASGPDPESFDLSPNGRELYASNEDAALASVLDVATGRTLRAIPVGREPEGVRVRPDGKVVYISCEEDHRVDVIDVKSRSVIARMPVGQRPRAIVFTRDGAKAYVTNELAGSVSVIDARAHQPIRLIPIPGQGAKPMGAALSPDGKSLYVSTGRGRSVVEIDTATDRVARTLEDVGTRPWGIAISADGRRAFTANGPSNDVSVIDLAGWRVTERIPVGKSPWGVAILERGGRR